MTITHHPSDVALADFAAGTLDEARALVVSAHAARCPQCRKAVRGFEDVGGALLDAINPGQMTADALSRTLAKLNVPQATLAKAALPDAETLSGYALGPWRWLGRGIRWRAVDVPSDDAVRVFMLKAAPGT